MSLSRPVWSGHYGGLFVRIPLGLYFILAARLKFHNVEGFIDTVRDFGILPMELSTLYGVLIPWLELGIGFALIFGILTSFAAGIASVLLASYILALGLFPSHPEIFNKDFILLGASLSLLASGSGAFSLDRLRFDGETS